MTTDDDFLPSGEWTGFFQQGGRKFRTDLVLTFKGGRLHGNGGDWVGTFTVRGRYDTGTGELNWVKTYTGAHDVHYRGFRERRSIWGVWEIPGCGRSGFKIWPRGSSDGEAIANEAAQTAPVAATPPRRAHSAP